MHDLHEADRILKLIITNAQQNKLNKITRAEIDLGIVVEHGAEILPENLEFNIMMLAQDTIAEGLELKINKIKADHWILKNIEGE